MSPDGPAVVFFYPAALTPGRTMEAKGFNDRYDAFRAAGHEVIGVSTDLTTRTRVPRRVRARLPARLRKDESRRPARLLKQYGDHGRSRGG